MRGCQWVLFEGAGWRLNVDWKTRWVVMDTEPTTVHMLESTFFLNFSPWGVSVTGMAVDSSNWRIPPDSSGKVSGR
jgi:hypothetical protein